MAFLVHNLDVRRASIKSCWPSLTIYWLGDAAHMARHSDHNPDSTGCVHALDVMAAVGPTATAVLNWCLVNHDDLEYVIHNHLIYERSNGFKPVTYTGTDPHTNHVHISGKHGLYHASTYTGNGYDLAAEMISPTGSPCGPVPVYQIGPYPGYILKLGDSGNAVAKIQRKLSLNGYPLDADGVFGPKTDAAVKKFKAEHKLTFGGLVGPVTWAAIARLPK